MDPHPFANFFPLFHDEKDDVRAFADSTPVLRTLPVPLLWGQLSPDQTASPQVIRLFLCRNELVLECLMT